ncbi:hypothetical protein [Herpetosiphon giganteus]|uniref:hypothetical protein n=1 Tax=Herpetosiphon giganteus TaxID=2029754 RepID=UPI00195DC64E|nr:hypothetical protein [Herpetosiphon giganteus]MBM7843201.1 hypothetical protein [Herpetosiphon giganteus]
MLDLTQLDQPAMLTLAHDPATASEQLQALAEWLKLVQVSHSIQPSTSLHYLTMLAPQGPLAIFLERSNASPVVEALVANPNTPATVALEFAAAVPAAFFANPALDSWLLANPNLFHQIEPLRVLQLLRYANIPAPSLALIRTISPAIAQTVELHIGSNPALAADWYAQYQSHQQQVALPAVEATILLQELLCLNAISEPMLGWLRQSSLEQHQRLFMQVAASSTPAFEPQTLDFSPKYATLLDAPFAQRLLVANSNDVKGLAILAEDDEPKIRLVVAQNQATPRTVHQLLELDDSQHVRAALASNHSITPTLLLMLARDHSWSGLPIRLAAARNPVATPEILALLAQDQASLVRQTVLQSQHIAPEIGQQVRQRALIEALYALDPWLHLLACGHPATPIEHLTKAVRSPWWLGRAALAENPSCPSAVLEQLANDGNCYVRLLAQRRFQHT